MSLTECDVDNFCGGGGASTGMEAATGRPVTIAVNHSRAAIAMHELNHPETRHYREDVWEVDPREAVGSRRCRLLWLSPDCKHHSKAKGGAPREKKIRGLAWVAIRWARTVKPAVILLENVEEFEDWGPVDDDGKVIKDRKGETFLAFVAALKSFGYAVEWRRIVAADHGAPTTRRRLFLVARSDGRPIAWPAATHGKGTESPWRTAAEIIDWSLECPSIFERSRPLKEATLRRIAAGVRRYVIEAQEPFIVPVSHTNSGARVHSVTDPMRTGTTARGGEFAFISPTLVTTGYGERPGQSPRVPGIGKPLGTVVAGGQKHGLVTAFLTKHYGKGVFKLPLNEPIGTVTAREHFTASHVALSPAGETPARDHREQVRAFLIAYYKSERDGQPLTNPLRTIPTHDRFGLVTVRGVDYEIADIGLRMLAPRELFNAQGFPESYRIDVELDGKPLTKADTIALAGNSVVPQVAKAIVGANLHERWETVA